MMSIFWTSILVLALSFSCSEGKPSEKLPSAIVVGSVYCDTSCSSLQNVPKTRHSIAGASVAVECFNKLNSSRSFREESKTDNNGGFRVKLPFNGGKIGRRVKGCSVKLISSSEASCSVVSSSSSSFKLRERREETLIFSAGILTFTPLKKDGACDDQMESPVLYDELPPIPFLPGLPPVPPHPRLLSLAEIPVLPQGKVKQNHDQMKSPILNTEKPTLFPPLPPFPPLPRFPPLPPLPPLPRFPPLLPGIPFLPPAKMNQKTVTNKPESNQNLEQVQYPTMFPFLPNPLQPLFPPIPFLPPPSLSPPLFPSPPASIFPPGFPFFPTPRPSPPATSLPQFPGLFTPSPPPPLFPFPFQKPGFPGIPASDHSNTP